MSVRLTIVLLLALALLPAAAVADTRFVSDQLIITLRDAAGEGASTLGTLRTDTPVEVLAEEGDYLRVRVADGAEGYVLKRYITAEVPKSEALNRLKKERDKLAADLKDREAKLSEATARLKELQGEKVSVSGESQQELERLRKALASAEQAAQAAQARYSDLEAKSKNVVALAADRDRLQAENEGLADEVALLRTQTEDLLISGVIKWFLAGAGVLFFGWVLGKASRKKRGGF